MFQYKYMQPALTNFNISSNDRIYVCNIHSPRNCNFCYAINDSKNIYLFCYKCNIYIYIYNRSDGHVDGGTKVYISTGIPTRVVGTCFCGEAREADSNLPIWVNFKDFSFVMTCNNKKDGAIFGCHITFCAITQYL